jgi:hypothetical protein
MGNGNKLHTWYHWDLPEDREFQQMKMRKLERAQSSGIERRARPISKRRCLVIGIMGIVIAISMWLMLSGEKGLMVLINWGK